MGRVNYTLLDRYTVSRTERADGSSRLAPGHKWAFFPSVGLAWQVGDEPFMRDCRSFNALKLRGSYGTTGNTAIDPYQTEGTLQRASLHVRHDARARLHAGIDPESRSRLGEDRPDGRRPRVRDCSTIVSPARSTCYRMNTHDLLLTQSAAGDVRLHVDAAERRLDEEHRLEIGVSTVNLQNWHGLALDERRQLDDATRTRSPRSRAARRPTSATSGSSVSRSTSIPTATRSARCSTTTSTSASGSTPTRSR